MTGAFIALFSAGLFFIVGLLTGVWKYAQMMKSPENRASKYVDTAHFASLFYAFACVLLERFCDPNAFSSNVVAAAVGVLVFFFGSAVAAYIILGFRRRETTQFAEKTFHTTWGMALLIGGEVIGFLVLFVGWLLAH